MGPKSPRGSGPSSPVTLLPLEEERDRGSRTQINEDHSHTFLTFSLPPARVTPAVSPKLGQVNTKRDPACHYSRFLQQPVGRARQGPATARFAPGTRPKGPHTAHLLHSRATSKPVAGLRTHSQRSHCSNAPYRSSAWLRPSRAACEPRGSLRAPGQPAEELLPIPPAVPRRPAEAQPPPPQTVFPPLHSAHPPSRPNASPALSAPRRGASGGCGPDPGVGASRGSLLCPPFAAGLHPEPLACAAPRLPAPGSGRPRRTFPCGAGERLRERPRPLRLPSSAATGLPPAAAAGTVGPSQPPRPVRGPAPPRVPGPPRLCAPPRARPPGAGSRRPPSLELPAAQAPALPYLANGTPHPPIRPGTEPAPRCPALRGRRGLLAL